REAKDDAIKSLEAELALLDTSSAALSKAKLVAIAPVEQKEFNHFIELQGKVEAENISYIAPRGMGGMVKAVYVKQGQQVSKGQLLLKLDDAIMQQQVVAAKQQLGGIKTQLAYAKDVLQRQQNLWNQGIGTEVQLIGARTNVEGLENQLKAMQEQVNVAIEQARTANVYSDVNGVAEIVNIRVGETFVGSTAAGPQIKIVNTNSLKAVVSVPENYATRIKKGSSVLIDIPDANKQVKASITMIGQAIDLVNRGFIAEAKMERAPDIKANQTIGMRILDYSAPNAMVVPVNLIQTDDKGKYVFVATKGNDGKLQARKRNIEVGQSYGEYMEVLSGLNAGEQLITQGYQNLYDGQNIVTN
ncbi:MAG: efflux RND transporter periplasmic adaptor subunit, partial [Ferruginibacter sp.]|nr:efflux RND transporter periplasmic adaptor subunit [Ferruginibacter sp.]